MNNQRSKSKMNIWAFVALIVSLVCHLFVLNIPLTATISQAEASQSRYTISLNSKSPGESTISPQVSAQRSASIKPAPKERAKKDAKASKVKQKAERIVKKETKNIEKTGLAKTAKHQLAKKTTSSKVEKLKGFNASKSKEGPKVSNLSEALATNSTSANSIAVKQSEPKNISRNIKPGEVHKSEKELAADQTTTEEAVNKKTELTAAKLQVSSNTETEKEARKDGAAQKNENSNQVVKNTNDGTAHANSDFKPASYKLGSAQNPKPYYPAIAKKNGWEGDVKLGVKVKPDGSIDNLTIVKGAPYGALTHAAWETVKQEWTFQAALQEGKAISSYIEVDISFKLQQFN